MDPSAMHLVVTGATGNIGTALLRLLRHWGAAVTAVTSRAELPRGEPYDIADWLVCDLRDPSSVGVLLPRMRHATGVVHLAWDIKGGRDRRSQRRSNVTGSEHVVAAAATAGARHLVYTSSVAAYTPDPQRPHLVDEGWPIGGIAGSAYSADKVAVERLLDAAHTRYPRLRVARLRPPTVLQPAAGGELARYVLGPLAPLAKYRWLRPPVVPLPNLATQLVHADDVAALILLALQASATGPFNAAAEPVLGADDLAAALGARRVPAPGALLRTVLAATYAVHLQPLDASWWDVLTMVPLVSSDRARVELGWRPRGSAQQTLMETRQAATAGTGTESPRLAPV